jgi:hypothetical protein
MDADFKELMPWSAPVVEEVFLPPDVVAHPSDMSTVEGKPAVPPRCHDFSV